MSERMSTSIDDIMDPYMDELPIMQQHDLPEAAPQSYNNQNAKQQIAQIANISPKQQEVPIQQQPQPLSKTDLTLKNPNVSNIQANVSVKKNFTDTFFTESNILLIIIVILAGLPQTNKLLLQILPRNLHNDIFITILKAIILCVIYIVIVNYLL
jgi:hypothetical protein